MTDVRTGYDGNRQVIENLVSLTFKLSCVAQDLKQLPEKSHDKVFYLIFQLN